MYCSADDQRARAGGVPMWRFAAVAAVAVLLGAPVIVRGDGVVLNEIGFDLAFGGVGDEADLHTWIELYNGTGAAVDLTGWTIGGSDGAAVLALPSCTLPAACFLTVHLMAGTDDLDFDDIDGHVFIDGAPALLDPEMGECAIYAGSPNATTIHDFVAWSRTGSYTPGVAHDDAVAAGIWTADAFVDGEEADAADTLGRYFDGFDRDVPNDWRMIPWSVYAHQWAFQPENPIQEWPENRAVIGTSTPQLDWSDVPDATAYDVQIDNDWDFSSPEVNVTGLTTSEYGVTVPLGGDAYFYRVRAHVNALTTPWAAEWLFTVQGAAQPDYLCRSCPFKWQRKDTHLLCLWYYHPVKHPFIDYYYRRPGCPETGDCAWDRPHPNMSPKDNHCAHGRKYCWAASIAMVNAKYGGDLSQDRIAYENWHTDLPEPEEDLGHNRGNFDGRIQTTLSWALNGAAITYVRRPVGGFTFDELKDWINTRDCFVAAVPGHCIVPDGYAQITDAEGTLIQVIYAHDPWLGPSYPHVFSYLIDGVPAKYHRRHRKNAFNAVWLQPTAGVTARMQEASVTTDSDGDGVMDFDEGNPRALQSNKDLQDTDADEVLDKDDIRNYTFHTHCDNDDLGFADVDNDGLRSEADCDSDNDSDFDGGEDIDGDGHCPEAGTLETCMFKPEHLITVSTDKRTYLVGQPVWIVDRDAGPQTRTYHASSVYWYELGLDCPHKVDNTPLFHSGVFLTDDQGRAFDALVFHCPFAGWFHLTVDVLNDSLYSEPDNWDPQACWQCVEPDQLHVVGPVPNQLLVGSSGSIAATVAEAFVGLPELDVTFTTLAGEITFLGSDARAESITVATDSDGVATAEFVANATGLGLVQISVPGTGLTAYSVFQITSARRLAPRELAVPEAHEEVLELQQ